MTTVFDGKWENQNKSVLELTVSGEEVSGRFDSGVGDDGQTLWIDIHGKILGDLITFSAAYPQYQTLITWIGQHSRDNGNEVIKTHWLHVTDIEDQQEQDWMWFTNRIGSDIFTRKE